MQIQGGTLCQDVRSHVLAMNGIDAQSAKAPTPPAAPEGEPGQEGKDEGEMEGGGGGRYSPGAGLMRARGRRARGVGMARARGSGNWGYHRTCSRRRLSDSNGSRHPYRSSRYQDVGT